MQLNWHMFLATRKKSWATSWWSRFHAHVAIEFDGIVACIQSATFGGRDHAGFNFLANVVAAHIDDDDRPITIVAFVDTAAARNRWEGKRDGISGRTIVLRPGDKRRWRGWWVGSIRWVVGEGLNNKSRSTRDLDLCHDRRSEPGSEPWVPLLNPDTALSNCLYDVILTMHNQISIFHIIRCNSM